MLSPAVIQQKQTDYTCLLSTSQGHEYLRALCCKLELGELKTRNQVLALLLTSSVTLGKLCHPLGPLCVLMEKFQFIQEE